MFDSRLGGGLRAELDFLASALGPVRDLDVLIARLEQDAVELDKGDTVAVSPPVAAASPARNRFDRTSVDARERPLLRAPRVSRTRVSGSTGEGRGLRPREGCAQGVRADGEAGQGSTVDASDGDLHALRIRGKRARYAPSSPPARRPAARSS
jgi:CHAD domain-containing protein